MYLEAKLELQKRLFCFHRSNLRADWVPNDITSCFAKLFPLPHLLFPHLLTQTSFSCIRHLLANLNILQFYEGREGVNWNWNQLSFGLGKWDWDLATGNGMNNYNNNNNNNNNNNDLIIYLLITRKYQYTFSPTLN